MSAIIKSISNSKADVEVGNQELETIKIVSVMTCHASVTSDSILSIVRSLLSVHCSSTAL